MLIAAYCLIALIIGITWEYYQKEPAVDILMFKNWSFASSCVLILTVSIVVSGVSFFIPFFSQTLLGYTAMAAGILGLPATIFQLITI